MNYVSKSEEEMREIATDFAASLETKFPSGVTVVGLYGELGAGKTTFMKGVAKFFGVKETIQSPTFVLMKRFKIGDSTLPAPARPAGGGRQGFKNLVHIDAYRIEKSDEMVNLGWNEIIADSENLIFVEWPERIADIMPKHVEIYFEHGEDENQRKISVQ